MGSPDLTTVYQHIPVLLAEVTQQLAPSPRSIVVDCTFGYGGHARELLLHVTPRATFIGIDQDEQAHHTQHNVARLGQQISARTDTEMIFVHDNFGNLDRILTEVGVPYVDTFLFDLGVSSPQIDDPARGFSFKEDGPLDMRMNRQETRTAAHLVNEESEQELARIIGQYGEEKWAGRIARFIVSQRARKPITTTQQLVAVIKDAIPASARRQGGHPAKRTFQGLRIALNDELGALERGLQAAIRWLRPGGRVGVLTFHSLEDRIVKNVFRNYAQGCICPEGMPICQCDNKPILDIITRRVITPSAEEIETNPRARSVKLRVAQKR